MVYLHIQNGNIIIIAMETTKFYVQSPKLDNTWHLQVIALSFIFCAQNKSPHIYPENQSISNPKAQFTALSAQRKTII